MYDYDIFTTINDVAAHIADTLEAGGGPVAAEFDIAAIIDECYRYDAERDGYVPNYVPEVDDLPNVDPDDPDSLDGEELNRYEMDLREEAHTWGYETFWESVKDNQIVEFDAHVRIDEDFPGDEREIVINGFNDYDVDPVVATIKLGADQDLVKALQAGGWTVVRTNDPGSWTVRRTH